MGCKVCRRDKKIAARGLCSACYARWWKKGTTDYSPKPTPQKCAVDGCDVTAVARSLCDRHYRRLMKHGDINGDARPDSWGATSNHPLTHSYKWIMRHRNRRPVSEIWDDFLQFAADVGERPSEHHRLCRKDDLRPIGPDNFYWRESVTRKKPGDSKAEAAARYQREYRIAHPDRVRHTRLANQYGVSLSDYENMLESQDHKCKICGVEENMKIRGKVVRLAVDHCHETGDIRGLLCSKCNQGLGCFKDRLDLLDAAKRYLTLNCKGS